MIYRARGKEQGTQTQSRSNSGLSFPLLPVLLILVLAPLLQLVHATPSNLAGAWRVTLPSGGAQVAFPLLPARPTPQAVFGDQFPGGRTWQAGTRVLLQREGRWLGAFYHSEQGRWVGNLDRLAFGESCWILLPPAAGQLELAVTGNPPVDGNEPQTWGMVPIQHESGAVRSHAGGQPFSIAQKTLSETSEPDDGMVERALAMELPPWLWDWSKGEKSTLEILYPPGEIRAEEMAPRLSWRPLGGDAKELSAYRMVWSLDGGMLTDTLLLPAGGDLSLEHAGDLTGAAAFYRALHSGHRSEEPAGNRRATSGEGNEELLYWLEALDGEGHLVTASSPNTILPCAGQAALGWVMERTTGEQDGGVEADSPLPRTFALDAVYPNPFNNSTTVRLALPEASTVHLRVHDLLGRCVLERRELLSAGYRQRSLDMTGHATGVYLLEVRAGEKQLGTRKILLMK